MATFNTKSFLKHDDYSTPNSAWDNIKHLIPNYVTIWEPFYLDGKSGNYLKELGFDVIHEPIDFFENNLAEVVISNPPFSKSKEVLTRLVQLNKPFILILPSSKINTQYVRNLFKDQKDKLQIIIPKKRIQFIKQVNGIIPENQKNACNFDCFYYCWKMNLDHDIIWLDDENE